MPGQFEFELVFALPDGEHDPYLLSDAVFEAGFEDAIIGTGDPRLLAVELELDGDDGEKLILSSARAVLNNLPAGTLLREVRPDLVSLADVAEKLNIKRQALAQREIPPPVAGGLYRIDELEICLEEAMQPGPGRRKARFDLEQARGWFEAGGAARQVNAKLTTRQIDPETLQAMPAQ